MRKTIIPTQAKGTVDAISSKSVAHRLLICAALADRPGTIICERLNKDIEATADCLRALGAEINYADGAFYVAPIAEVNKQAILDCGESGSTLRFLLPVAAALGGGAGFVRHGRLASRPLSPLYEELAKHGAVLSAQEAEPLTCEGRITSGVYQIDGGVSSQYISGLLFALPLLRGKCALEITGQIESRPYIDMTLNALKKFAVEPVLTGQTFTINDDLRYISPGEIKVEGDWSNAAFFLSIGAIGSTEGVTVTGLDLDSAQGDKRIAELLRQFGAQVKADEASGSVTVCRGELHGIKIDAAQIPDLVPILATVAAAAEGETHIYNAARLRIKESDRLQAVRVNLEAMGAEVIELEDSLIIKGGRKLHGATVSSFNDHRMAMSAAAAGLICEGELTIDGAEAVQKSYPDFWEDFAEICQGGVREHG